MIHHPRTWRATMLAAAFALAFTASCEKEGPTERAGKEVDKAAAKAGDAIEDAGDKAEEAVD